MAALSGYVLPLAGLIGAILVLTSRRRGPKHPSCGKCGYDLTGHVDLRSPCPECGSALAQVGVTPAGQMKRDGMRYGLGVALMAPFMILLFMGLGLIVLLIVLSSAWR